jgi:LDH2 family malate/lactate/ureidoglycolate dehydrogenase
VETTVRIEALQDSLAGCLRALGFAPEAAARMAEVFVDSELRGYDDHGAIMIQFYAGWVRCGEVDPRARLETVHETPGTALLEGHRADGVTSATAAMRLAMTKARSVGIGCVSLRHTGHFVAGAPYVELAAREGFIGIACANSNNLMAPPGSNTRVLGTNPLAVGLPAATQEPVIFDMATSAIAGGKIRMLGLAGQPVPSGILLDAVGAPTTVADDYLQRGGSILPLGGEHALHKGFGLSMLVDALAGVLSGAGFAMTAGTGPDKEGEGRFFLAIDPGAILPGDAFARRMDEQIAQIKGAARLPGVEEILVPGERGLRRRRELLARGTVTLGASSWHALTRECSALGVPLPAPVAA